MTDPAPRTVPPPAAAARPLPPARLAPLAVAAVAALGLWWGSRPADRWVVLESVDAERDEGLSLDAGDRFAFATVTTPGIGSADLQLGEAVRIVVQPGSEVELPPAPGRWIGEERALRVIRGRILVTTGDRGPDFDLVVLTPHSRTRAASATFSVERISAGTRICAGRGRVEAETPRGDRTLGIPEGMQAQLYAGGLEPEIGPQTDEERARLEAVDLAGISRDLP
jgi:hypothetical protein